jgi:hypothetical protein
MAGLIAPPAGFILLCLLGAAGAVVGGVCSLVLAVRRTRTAKPGTATRGGSTPRNEADVEIVRFEALASPSPVRGQLRYVTGDHAFNFWMDPDEQGARRGNRGTTSFVINTLQLEVAIDTSLCLYAWGYCPVQSWKASSLSSPVPSRGSLRAYPAKPLVPGVSVGLESTTSTDAWFDPASGWFCMGDKDGASHWQAVEFATSCVGVVADGRLSSLWLRPGNWKELAEMFSAAR